MILNIEEKIIGPCNNCNHHFEKTCPNAEANAKWWADNGRKTDRSALDQMECFIEPESSKSLREMNDAVQKLLDHLKTKDQ